MKTNRTLRSPPVLNKLIKRIQAKKYQEQFREVPTSKILNTIYTQIIRRPKIIKKLFDSDYK